MIAIIQGKAIPGFVCIAAALKMIKAISPTIRPLDIFRQKMEKVPGYIAWKCLLNTKQTPLLSQKRLFLSQSFLLRSFDRAAVCLDETI